MLNKLFVLILSASIAGAAVSCKTSRQSGVRSIQSPLSSDSLLQHAHSGVYVYDPAAGKVLVDYQSDKYFVPASNTKIVTCYAAMKYLKDSLPGISWIDADTAIILFPQADPSFLHPDFTGQRIVDFLKQQKRPIYISDASWHTSAFGSGWNWGDYSEDYMPERSALPVYGNVIRWHQAVSKKENPQTAADTIDRFIYSDPEISWPVEFAKPDPVGGFSVKRALLSNAFTITEGGNKEVYSDVPFITYGVKTAIDLLKDTVHKEISVTTIAAASSPLNQLKRNIINSVPTDSLLRPMMQQSDNFFAEQILLMVGQQQLNKMNEDAIIRELLSKDLSGFPQTPSWADGSGLSRFNLFTPQDFVWLLGKMKSEFGMMRIKNIFPTAGIGTLKNYAPALKDKVYAKTGSLSNVISLSGFLQTASGKELIFSFLVNNHRESAAAIRARFNAMLLDLYNKY